MTRRMACISILALAASTFLEGQPRVHDPAKAEVLTITLLPEGFATPQVTVDSGIYLIDVQNRSGIRGVSVAVDRMPGASLQSTIEKHEADGQDDRNSSRFIKTVTLTRGTYRVQILGHPNWVCAISVK